MGLPLEFEQPEASLQQDLELEAVVALVACLPRSEQFPPLDVIILLEEDVPAEIAVVEDAPVEVVDDSPYDLEEEEEEEEEEEDEGQEEEEEEEEEEEQGDVLVNLLRKQLNN